VFGTGRNSYASKGSSEPRVNIQLASVLMKVNERFGFAREIIALAFPLLRKLTQVCE
jgi:hypothetical protein